MTDTSGMLPNWLSEAVGNKRNAKEIAEAIHPAKEWTDLIAEAVKEAEQIMQTKGSLLGPGGGYPSYNHEVARGIVTRLARFYPEISLAKP